jgi:predicted nucleotidyltransferase
VIPSEWHQKLEQWAKGRPGIEVVWIFGSYAKGCANAESDLDIALIVKSPLNSEDDYTHWFFNKGKWRTELAELLPVSVDLHIGNSDISTAIVAPAVQDHGILVYCSS